MSVFLYNRGQNYFNKKIKNMWKIIALLWVTTLGLVWGVSFVFGGNLVFNPEVRFVTSASQTVYLDNDSLNSTVLVYQSNIDISDAAITSLCDISSELLTQSKWVYFFRVDYSQAGDCKNGNIVLSLWEDDYVNTIHTLNLVNDVDIYSIFIDYSSEKIKQYQEELHAEIQDYSIYKNYDGKDIIKYYPFFTRQKIYQNAVYKNSIINDILLTREQ